MASTSFAKRRGSIGEGQIDGGNAAPGRLQQRDGTVTVLHARRMHRHLQRPAVRVHHGVSLARLDLLARIVAARAASLGGLHALTVDNGSTRAGFATDALAVQHD